MILKNLLKKLPNINDGNKFADYIELLCLVSNNGQLFVADVYDRLSDDVMGEFEDDEETSKSAIEDRQQQQVKSIFRNYLATRSRQLVDFYPFEYEDIHCSISLKNDLNPERKFYIALLLSSNLSFINTPHSSQLPKIFETASFEIFKQFFPKKSQVHYFGAGGIRRNSSVFKGNLFKKIKDLAVMLHLDILKNITEEEIGKHNTGDNGLDLVGWYSFKDNAPGTMMTFAQCACGDDWEDKQIESHSFRWRNYIHFYNQPSNIIFFPRQYRKPDGSWLKTTTINDTVLIDRKRLLELFEKTQNSHFMPQYESIIDQVLKEKISDFD